MNKAKIGDFVRVQYFAHSKTHTSAHRPAAKLLEFTVGSGEVIPGISLGVVGMAEGETRRLTLQPQDGYGAVLPKLISEVPRKKFPQHLDLHAGQRLVSVNPSGRRKRVNVVEVKRTTVVVDANHPLAGKVLEIEIRLLSIQQSSANKDKPPFDLGGEG